MAFSARKKQIIQGALGNQGPFFSPPPNTIPATYAPTNGYDEADALGQIWVDFVAGTAYVAVQNANGATNWLSFNQSIAASVASLTVTAGPTQFNYLTAKTVPYIDASKQLQTLTLSNGQFVIGNTSSIPRVGQLTSPGGTVSINYSDPNIELEVTGTGLDWSDSPKAASFNADVNHGYRITAGSGAVTVTLPASPAVGEVVAVYYASATSGDSLIMDARAGGTIQLTGAAATRFQTSIDAGDTGGQYPGMRVACVNATGPVWGVESASSSYTGS